MKPFQVAKGDTFFTRSNSWLGRLIRWGEKDPGEEAAWTNHAGVVVEDGWIGDPGIPGYKEAIVIEALSTVRKGPLKLNGVDVRVFRPIPVYTPMEKVYFVTEANKFLGEKYGWWKLFLQLGDRAIFRGRKVLSNISFIDKRPICSYLSAKVNNAARKLGSKGPGYAYWPLYGLLLPEAADPDTMLDFCEHNPTFWEEVK